MPNRNEWKNGEEEKFLKILEDFVHDFINIFQKNRRNTYYTYDEHSSTVFTQSYHHSKKQKMPAQTQYWKQNWKRAKACEKQKSY